MMLPAEEGALSLALQLNRSLKRLLCHDLGVRKRFTATASRSTTTNGVGRLGMRPTRKGIGVTSRKRFRECLAA